MFTDISWCLLEKINLYPLHIKNIMGVIIEYGGGECLSFRTDILQSTGGEHFPISMLQTFSDLH